MSGAGSDPTGDSPAFVEDDTRETRLPYDTGGLPWYVAVGWVVLVIAYVAIMSVLALPDLRRWLAH